MTRSIGAWLPTVAMLLGLAGCAHLNTAATKPEQTSIVRQVSDGDPKTWNQALNVVRNLQSAYGADKVDIEVVVFGNGIGLLEKDSPYASRVSETIVGGTQALMCENTVAGRKKTRADRLGDIGFVKAGVVEITEKSKAGWTVIRP